MSTAHNVSITLGDNTLSVDCHYTPGTPDVWYLRNGDPGYPGDPEEIEIERIRIGQEDVTELLATLWVEKRGTITRDIKYVPVWEILEQKCLEEIYETQV